jgi:hypothetical protein
MQKANAIRAIRTDIVFFMVYVFFGVSSVFRPCVGQDGENDYDQYENCSGTELRVLIVAKNGQYGYKSGCYHGNDGHNDTQTFDVVLLLILCIGCVVTGNQHVALAHYEDDGKDEKQSGKRNTFDDHGVEMVFFAAKIRILTETTNSFRYTKGYFLLQGHKKVINNNFAPAENVLRALSLSANGHN